MRTQYIRNSRIYVLCTHFVRSLSTGWLVRMRAYVFLFSLSLCLTDLLFGSFRLFHFSQFAFFLLLNERKKERKLLPSALLKIEPTHNSPRQTFAERGGDTFLFVSSSRSFFCPSASWKKVTWSRGRRENYCDTFFSPPPVILSLFYPDKEVRKTLEKKILSSENPFFHLEKTIDAEKLLFEVEKKTKKRIPWHEKKNPVSHFMWTISAIFCSLPWCIRDEENKTLSSRGDFYARESNAKDRRRKRRRWFWQ